MFKTSESGDKGQLLDGDPSYVTNDEALVKNLDLELQGRRRWQRGGADPELPLGARRTRRRLLAYFYEPQWFFDEMDLQRVDAAAVRRGL